MPGNVDRAAECRRHYVLQTETNESKILTNANGAVDSGKKNLLTKWRRHKWRKLVNRTPSSKSIGKRYSTGLKDKYVQRHSSDWCEVMRGPPSLDIPILAGSWNCYKSSACTEVTSSIFLKWSPMPWKSAWPENKVTIRRQNPVRWPDPTWMSSTTWEWSLTMKPYLHSLNPEVCDREVSRRIFKFAHKDLGIQNADVRRLVSNKCEEVVLGCHMAINSS